MKEEEEEEEKITPGQLTADRSESPVNDVDNTPESIIMNKNPSYIVIEKTCPTSHTSQTLPHEYQNVQLNI